MAALLLARVNPLHEMERNVTAGLDVENKDVLFLEISLFGGHQVGSVGYVD